MEPLAQKPQLVTLCPGAIVEAHDGGVTVTVSPLRVIVPLQLWLITVEAGNVNRSVQPLTVVEPLFLTIVVRQ